MILELEDKKIDNELKYMPNKDTLEAIEEMKRYIKYGDESGVSVYSSVEEMFKDI